ncbi:hypothetical protein M011DRAFT_285979 [Sporormia fimetaria CBS 119925]|uniref:Zn(2)-C6 fungal-type domain-containing protein n=1 Tax=Sporormia fimetaria CBS 119925 TaxID=1340428 RepID=A0A6A6VHE3_9PLEO|nr:hypothetical protein M011DRAFT_285979 [Sporormia fimetaria CBS 119925]
MMASRPDAPTITRRRSVLACARCRARRVKCDRAQPACTNCTKVGALCQSVQQQHSPSGQRPGRGDSKDPVDYTRLSKLEQEVARLSREVNSASPSREPSRTPSIDDAVDPKEPCLRGILRAEPHPAYFSSSSWASVAEELLGIQASIERPNPEIFTGSTSNTQDPRLTLPDEALHDALLQVFRSRVDPLVHVLHWPTFSAKCKAFRGPLAAQDHVLSERRFMASSYADKVPQEQLHESVPLPLRVDSFSALLCAVYYSALLTLTENPHPVDFRLHIDVQGLLAIFRREVQTRLFNVRGEHSISSLETLQAMTLVLAVECDPFGNTLQPHNLQMTIARARELGLHRDGSLFDLLPLEVEHRRRIWAQLCILDVKYAEALGREPTVSPGSYDTILPLGIEDEALADLQDHAISSRTAKDSIPLRHPGAEYEQEGQFPFTIMTFLLAEAEIARLMAQLLTVRYQASDAISLGGSPFTDTRTNPRAPSERFQLIGQVEHRLRTDFGISSSINPGDTVRCLISDLVAVNIAKAAFLVRATEWKADYAIMSERRRETETRRLYHDATTLATRTISLQQRYAESPYSWYTSRVRDVHTSSFLALQLTFGLHMDDHNLEHGQSMLEQLFPIQIGPASLNKGLHYSIIGRLIWQAREKRRTPLPSSQPFQGQAIQAVTAGEMSDFPTTMNMEVPFSLPAGSDFSSYHGAGASYADYDAIMNDTAWPADLSAAEGYSLWSS